MRPAFLLAALALSLACAVPPTAPTAPRPAAPVSPDPAALQLEQLAASMSASGVQYSTVEFARLAAWYLQSDCQHLGFVPVGGSLVVNAPGVSLLLLDQPSSAYALSLYCPSNERVEIRRLDPQ